MELFWATLSLILALKRLLGSSLGAASGSLRAHNLSIRPMDRDLGPLRELLGALLTASPRSRGHRALRCGLRSSLGANFLRFYALSA